MSTSTDEVQPANADAPALVPARMVNEILYCERLFYLEWVQREFEDNVYTVDGRITHRRADQPQGRLPVLPDTEGPPNNELVAEAPPPEEDRPYKARSVWLSSERLGLTSKLDVVEGEGGRVVPIEYKRGRAPEVPEGAYLPERAQVCVQVLLLREHGYQCDHAEIYFAGDRRRVAIAITDELVATTLAAMERARALAREAKLPPPLRDSPKCDGCSLAGICLPDEVSLLQQEPVASTEPEVEVEPPDEVRTRRLYPARDDRLPLYVQAHRAKISVEGERLMIREGEDKTECRLPNTSQVVVMGNAQVTTPALRALLDRDIPLSFFTYGGWFLGRTMGLGTKNVELRLAQYRLADDRGFCLRVARRLVASKILNCRTMLRRNHASPDEVTLGELRILASSALRAEALESLLGIEGSAARLYFQSFSGMLGNGREVPEFDFGTRNRRPPRDPVNALLSFCYALLTRELTLAVQAVGLDPLLGVYHQPRHGRPALALDLMEEFRPLIADSVVLAVINNGVVEPDDFVHAVGSCALRPNARKRVIAAYERRMDHLVTHPVFGYRLSYRRVLELQARLFTRVLHGELRDYPMFRTR